MFAAEAVDARRGWPYYVAYLEYGCGSRSQAIAGWKARRRRPSCDGRCLQGAAGRSWAAGQSKGRTPARWDRDGCCREPRGGLGDGAAAWRCAETGLSARPRNAQLTGSVTTRRFSASWPTPRPSPTPAYLLPPGPAPRSSAAGAGARRPRGDELMEAMELEPGRRSRWSAGGGTWVGCAGGGGAGTRGRQGAGEAGLSALSG